MSHDYKMPTTAPTSEPLGETPEAYEARLKGIIQEKARREARQWVKDSTPTPPKESRK
jgi:hypothetical protein